MRSSRFVSLLLGASLLFSLTGFSVNYVIDPYNVFGSGYLPRLGQLQERYLKVEYLKKHPHFNTVLFGSSRIGVVRTEDMDAHFSGAKSYNFTVSQADQWDNEKHIEWLIKNMPEVSRVIVQIDWPYTYGAKQGYELMTEMHPDITGRARYGFLLDHLTIFNPGALKQKVATNWEGIDAYEYDMSKGYWSIPLRDKKIELNCKDYVAREDAFHPASFAPVKNNPAVLADSLAAIARYKKLLDKANIKLTVFLTPQNHLVLNYIDAQDYAMFLTQLAHITDFYNFMFYNPMTKNDCNYYEATHYRPVVGEMLVRSLAEPPGTQSGIYQYVSGKTLDSHLEFVKTNFSSARTP